MKKLKLLSLFLFATMLFVVSCKDDTPPVPPVQVGFKYSPENPVAGDLVTFTNASNGGTNFSWDFGDGNNSTEKNPKHVYTKSGKYTVVLKVDNKDNQKYSKEIEVADALPVITYTPELIQAGIEVTFSATIYNPDNAAVEYTWAFDSDNVVSDDLDDNGTAKQDMVTVRFINPNPSETVSVTATLDGLDYTKDVGFEVKAQLAPTLYIAEKGGDIWTKKLYKEGVSVLTDMGIESGQHPLTLAYSNDRIYIFDAGEIIKYTTEPAETIPGKIVSMNYDGSDYITHLTFGLSPFDDAFFGSVVEDTIYFTDRRNDVTVITTSVQNRNWDNGENDENPNDFPALVVNNQLAYYNTYRKEIDNGPSYGWGATNGTFTKYKGLYYWAKNSKATGLYIFSDNDIGVTDKLPSDPGEGVILSEYAVRAFVIDDVYQKIYFSSNKIKPGMFVCNIDGSEIEPIDESPFDAEGGDAEKVGITGIAIDYETGYVYWAYRGPGDADTVENPLQKSGIKKYKLDGTGEVEYLVEGIEAYGIAIDPNKR